MVSYLSGKPFLYGLSNSKVALDIDLELDIPARIASKMTFSQTDIGLMPVASLDDLNEYHIISPYCIGSTGKVGTAVLASQVPIEFIDTILMDYQARSAVALAKVLAKFFWRKDFVWENSCAGYENASIRGTTAGIITGDRVFDFQENYLYRYDLSEEWAKFTALPFVFAVWVAQKNVSEQFQTDFNRTLEFGLENISEIVRMEQSNYPGLNIHDYFSKNISFKLDNRKKAGMEKFLELTKKLEFEES